MIIVEYAKIRFIGIGLREYKINVIFTKYKIAYKIDRRKRTRKVKRYRTNRNHTIDRSAHDFLLHCTDFLFDRYLRYRSSTLNSIHRAQ